NKTTDELYNVAVAGFEQKFNTKFRLLPKAFIRVLCKVMAGLWIILYKQQAWIFLQIFPDTASFEEVEVFGKKIRPLVKWGELIGVGSPESATVFAGTITGAAVADGFLYSGTQLKSTLTNKVYLVAQTIQIFAGESFNAGVYCAESGTAGNLAINDTLSFVAALGNVKKDAVITAVSSEAVDGESENSYRNRVSNHWRTQPQGGASADYREWAADVPGVYQTYIYNDDDSATGVIIYVCANEETTGSRIAESSLLIAVGEACTYNMETGVARKPMGAVLDPLKDGTYKNIKSISETSFDVRITGYTGDISVIKETAKSQIKNYLKEREPYIRGLSVDDTRKDKIEANNISSIVNEIAINETESFGSVQLLFNESALASYTLDKGELATLGHLFINGTEV
ncbi:MAG: baseplate J/gp47 family protein, partial [Treponema sp.]|nr:baseplate J/gp47 family protein [Treponema sp.]